MAGDRTNGMPAGGVRVAVINGRLPDVGSRSLARRAVLGVARLVVGIAEGMPGLDLLVLPEYGVHGTGCQPSGRAFTEPEDDLEELSRACRQAGIWLAAPVGGGAVGRSGPHRMALLGPDGRVVARHASDPGTPGSGRSTIGPGGLRTVLTFADRTGAGPRDPALRGAELVVLLRAEPSDRPSDILDTARAVAWTHGCYVVSANAHGTDGSHRWAGWSSIAAFDGTLLARCEDEECEVADADLSPALLRRDRHLRTGAAGAIRTVLRRTQSRPAGRRPGTQRTPSIR